MRKNGTPIDLEGREHICDGIVSGGQSMFSSDGLGNLLNIPPTISQTLYTKLGTLNYLLTRLPPTYHLLSHRNLT